MLRSSFVGLCSVLALAPPARAEVTRTPIRDAEVVVFDATCSPASDTEGSLQVELQGEISQPDPFSVNGTFHSFTPPASRHQRQQWNLIPLERCRNLESKLRAEAGRRLLLSGDNYARTYETTEDVWGTCRNHPMEGGTRPCRTGTRTVTKIEREVFFNVGEIILFYSSRN